MNEKEAYLSEEERLEVEAPREIVIRSEDSEAKISPEKGALITAFKVGSVDVLHIDHEAFKNPENKKLKMGIPLLIPQAGQDEKIRQHGFGREVPWVIEEQTENTVTLSLKPKDIKDQEILKEIKENYPYNFYFEVTSKIRDSTLKYKLGIGNQGQETMPVAPGLHPYFKVGRNKQGEMVSNLEGFDLRNVDWRKEEPLFFNPPKAEATWFTLPGIGKVTMKMSDAFKKIVVWSMPEKDFICVEPWVGSVGALQKPEERLDVKPGEEKILKVEFHFEPENQEQAV